MLSRAVARNFQGGSINTVNPEKPASYQPPFMNSTKINSLFLFLVKANPYIIEIQELRVWIVNVGCDLARILQYKLFVK